MIEKDSAEVDRLAKLKASRMKELVFKKRSELEEICRLTHIEPDPSIVAEKASALIDSGLVDPFELLAKIEEQIIKAKNEVLSRKEVTDRIDKWFAACEEENWLDKYNQDDNRYSVGQCNHINLKRAEHARITIGKIPAIVDNLINKTLAWEDEKKTYFLYDRASFEVLYMWVSMPCNRKRKIRETTEGKFTCLYTFGNYLLFVHKLTCLYTFGAWGSLINSNTILVYIYV
ncbi:65-kDa microtubule-associated protein 6 isoform X2 [Glycine max]|uniref:65-kDa microtubule-associated protein 6 isoform X2 n=2 Tax=Glycine max TaxID=3847 RepID=UPI0007194320|nr:65-kDa microtubule-associated protein 6-like isoform X2 [Glycine max]|eukprot:XP_014630850.1 65-kDa microtubule-associated protein 6-like isoform X1 [Glycine max]